MIVDPYLDILRDVAHFLDSQLSKLDREAGRAEDPDMSGQYGSAEYITGLGFVACQQYMTCTTARKGITKHIALDLGPRHRNGVTFAALVNAAANYWKHRVEWDGPSVNQTRADQRLQSLQCLGVKVGQPYVLASALHEILRPHPARFTQLVPFFERWRDDLQSNEQ